MAPFQAGQRSLITASSKIKQTSPSLSQKMAQLTIPPVIETKTDPKQKKNHTAANPTMERTDSTLTKKLEIIVKYPRTLLVGDSTVEWYARVLDPDGQYDGDIVGAGRVAYATRKSDVRTPLYIGHFSFHLFFHLVCPVILFHLLFYSFCHYY